MTNKTSTRKPYSGDRRALVLAFDVGTTFSGVSYAFLEPGEVPKIHGITRYPGQEHVTGNTKIPSILFYDRKGKVRAAGAEAEDAQVLAQAEDDEWSKVELFKLRLRPKAMKLDMNGMKLSSLPTGKSSEDVFGDFLRYLYKCSRKFIEDTHANGKKLWETVEKDIHFVLSHPNGWEGAQQARMRRAAIRGGLIPDTDEGKARIRFVTEGEASMHACILSGLASDVLSPGNGFIVADAGGGTLDISSYVLKGVHPLTIEEVAPPDCLFAGAVFVSRRARVFLADKLKDSKYGTPDTLDHITKRFDETTKRLFRDRRDPQYIPFGSPLDKDLKVGIRSGQLKLTGEEVAELFEPSIQAAVASITRQYEASKGTVKAVWLVGGFAASPWLFSQLRERLAPMNISVNRPDTQTSKAVADGAIGFFCDHHVSARMARYMYGVEFLREIDLNDEEHVTRQNRLLQLPSGPKYLPDAFDCILAKNVRVKESSVFSRKYYTEVTKIETLSVFEIEIWCYRGGDQVPKWIDRHSDQFASLCYVRADLSKLSSAAEPKKGADGQKYWLVVFAIEILFGLTEFKARMKWVEDGQTRYGPASIVFNEKGSRSDEDDAVSLVNEDFSDKASSRAPSVAPSIGRSQSDKTDITAKSDSTRKARSKRDSKAFSAATSPVTSRPSSIHSSRTVGPSDEVPMAVPKAPSTIKPEPLVEPAPMPEIPSLPPTDKPASSVGDSVVPSAVTSSSDGTEKAVEISVPSDAPVNPTPTPVDSPSPSPTETVVESTPPSPSTVEAGVPPPADPPAEMNPPVAEVSTPATEAPAPAVEEKAESGSESTPKPEEVAPTPSPASKPPSAVPDPVEVKADEPTPAAEPERKDEPAKNEPSPSEEAVKEPSTNEKPADAAAAPVPEPTPTPSPVPASAETPAPAPTEEPVPAPAEEPKPGAPPAVSPSQTLTSPVEAALSSTPAETPKGLPPVPEAAEDVDSKDVPSAPVLAFSASSTSSKASRGRGNGKNKKNKGKSG